MAKLGGESETAVYVTDKAILMPGRQRVPP